MRRDPSESRVRVHRVLEVFRGHCSTNRLRCSPGVSYLTRTFPNVSSGIYRSTVAYNHSVDHLSAQLPSTLPAGSFDNQTRPSGVTIMSLKRGFTNEGDRILDYLVRIYATLRSILRIRPYPYLGKGYIRGYRETVPSPLHLCYIFSKLHTHTSVVLFEALNRTAKTPISRVVLT